MVQPEKALLLDKPEPKKSGLSTFLAAICIVDVFGVFPIVALAKPILNCGEYGIIILLIVVVVQMYTAILLGKSWMIARNINDNIQERCPYKALAELSCGTKVAGFVSLLLNITIFTAGVPNIIVASQNLELLGVRISDFNLSYCYWMIVIGIFICPILWLGSPKDMKCLCASSVMIVILVFLLLIICLLKIEESPRNFPSDLTLTFLENVALAYGVISFQFDIHPTILTIQVDMNNQKNISKTIIMGFLITLSMFGVVYKLICVKFGMSISESLLESLPPTIFLHLCALLVAFQLILSLAVGNTALYQQIENSLGISRDFNFYRCIIRSFITILGVIIAESVPRFDVVMAVIGGTLTGPLIYIFPPIFYIKMLHLKSDASDDLLMEDIIQDPSKLQEIHVKYGFSYMNRYKSSIKLSKTEKIEFFICILVLIFGILGTIATTYVNLKNAYIFSNFTSPCIYNLTVL
ncbi:uncharacterized protein [Onthophagus taurus]|uniref:uncharacterized protein n=1 Tax=Onthophagus taurus TaxID=166361 RepID=UPI000C206902|nr:sodium-coupled neutral amino acid transporter 2-like [Onthophagus taurus]